MAYIEASNFPIDIDDLPFVSDVDLAHKPIMQTHENYLSNDEYTLASSYLDSQTDITPINAGLLNLIENRIISTQEYLLTLTPVARCNYGSEPASPMDGTIWIE